MGPRAVAGRRGGPGARWPRGAAGGRTAQRRRHHRHLGAVALAGLRPALPARRRLAGLLLRRALRGPRAGRGALPQRHRPDDAGAGRRRGPDRRAAPAGGPRGRRRAGPVHRVAGLPARSLHRHQPAADQRRGGLGPGGHHARAGRRAAPRGRRAHPGGGTARRHLRPPGPAALPGAAPLPPAGRAVRHRGRRGRHDAVGGGPLRPVGAGAPVGAAAGRRPGAGPAPPRRGHRAPRRRRRPPGRRSPGRARPGGPGAGGGHDPRQLDGRRLRARRRRPAGPGPHQRGRAPLRGPARL